MILKRDDAVELGLTSDTDQEEDIKTDPLNILKKLIGILVDKIIANIKIQTFVWLLFKNKKKHFDNVCESCCSVNCVQKLCTQENAYLQPDVYV